MDLIATVLAATATIELFAALLFALAFVRRRTDREYAIAAVVGVTSAQHAVGMFLAGRQATLIAALACERLAALGLIAALALTVHFALSYRGGRSSWSVLFVLYGVAAVLAALNVESPSTDRYRVRPLNAWAGSQDFAHPNIAFGTAAALTYLMAIGAATVALIWLARAYLAGRHGGLAVVVGATVLLATTINDLGVATGAFATGYLGDAGFAALLMGIATTPSARYAGASFELERRTNELRTRTHELRRSYEELRAAQEELVKKEQLAVVGELAAVIAHEVRNPLAIIANAVAGLRKQAISREDHEVLLAILDEETSRLNRLVTDLLRYARPVNLQRTRIVLGDLLERALALANTGTKSIRRELSVEVQEGRLWGDANLLRQVFDNLIDNAVQAMVAGGNLTIRVRASSDDGLDGLAVDIIDTGEGMDTQVRSRALDPFFTTRPSGTGLGLAIVDRIVDAHGGHLAIDSRAGEGTTVSVFLPHGSSSEPPQGPRRSRLSGTDMNA
ncbi:MAG: ATP-binding protein [Polyangiaceae bacterium]